MSCAGYLFLRLLQLEEERDKLKRQKTKLETK